MSFILNKIKVNKFVRQLFCTRMVLITSNGDFSHQIQASELCDVSRCEGHVRKAKSGVVTSLCSSSVALSCE